MEEPTLRDQLLEQMEYIDTRKECCRVCKHRVDRGREGPEPYCTLNGAIELKIEDHGSCRYFIEAL